jgi:hypothetical protein
MTRHGRLFATRALCGAVILVLCAGAGRAAAASDDWAAAVLAYTRGPNAASGYTNAAAALGEAARDTLDWSATSPVTLVNPAWQPDQIVSLGDGGSLTLAMGADVINEDDPVHPYGVDLIVYGNALFAAASTADLFAATWYGLSAEPAEIWVSADTQNWFRARDRYADALMPTQSRNLDGTPMDYLRPINPALLTNDWFEAEPPWTYSNTVVAYDGAAGGCPVDLNDLIGPGNSATSLAWIRYVKFIDLPDGKSSEIDAVARVASVPEAGTLTALAACLWRRSRKA